MRSALNVAALFIVSLFLARVAVAEEPQQPPIALPSGGVPAVAFDADAGVTFRVQNIQAESRWEDIEDMPFSQAFRIDADTRFSDPDNMVLRIPVVEPIREGDVVLLSFWVRRPRAGGQPNNLYLSVDAAPDTPGYTYNLSGYKTWKQHVRSFTAPRDFQPNQHVRLRLGQAGPHIQLADLRLINYGPGYDIDALPRSTVMYPGREPDAAWRAEAIERIERIRKADLRVQVVDTQGNPVPDARVHVAMQRHAFGFGNAVNLRVLAAPQEEFPISGKRGSTVTWEDAQQYREIVKTYFDRVTFESALRPHSWIAMSADGGNRKYRTLMEHARPWLIDNDIAARGHYIAWAPMDFNQIERDFIGDPEGHRAWLWANMADVLPETADFVTEWDTINHIIGWGRHTYEKEYGGPQIYADIMAEARRLAPHATHAINEGKVLPDGYKREPYLDIIRFLDEQGQAPDIVGFMGHFGLTTLTPPEELLAVYDDFAEVAPKLQLSEFDVDAGDDTELQADYFRDVMIASFSHPNFVAICQWGFWETMHWKPAAALWNADWTLKPVGEVFVDLVGNQWWTDETIQTNDAGQAALRAFHGAYLITVQVQDQTVVVGGAELGPDGETIRIVIPDK